MKNLNALLLIVFLLSSCAPAATTVPTLTAQPTETITPSPTATQAPSPTPTIAPTPTQIGGGSGKLIFEYYRVAYEKAFPDLKGKVNVFTSNWDGTGLTPVTNGLKGLNLIESISPDGKLVLISSRSSWLAKGDLYLIHLNLLGADPIKLAGGLEVSQWSQAIFLDNAHIVYIGKGREGYGFYITNIDGTDSKKIGAPTGGRWEIVSSDKTRVYWESIQGDTHHNPLGGLWWINIDGSGQGKLESNDKQIIPDGGFGDNKKYAFSPDSTKIAWIPNELEPDCSYLYLAFWTPDIRNGKYTEFVTFNAGSEYRNSPHVGKVIDTAYVEDHVRHCFILHVASLSNLDKDIKIPLIPPFDPNKEDFYYHRDYVLTWWPDSSKILAYDTGFAMGRWGNTTGHYPLALYEVPLKDTNPKLVQLKVLSNSSMVETGPYSRPRLADSFYSFKFSPDGRQIMFANFPSGNLALTIKVLNLETMNYVDDFGHNITPDLQVRRVGNIYWLP